MLRFMVILLGFALAACGGDSVNGSASPEPGVSKTQEQVGAERAERFRKARDEQQSHPSRIPSELKSVQLPPLPELFDCVREEGGVLIAAHRGGPARGLPENALETMQVSLNAGIRVFEVDVATSQDGVLYLMHDRSLRRTTGYDGGVADTDWSTVSDLNLKDASGDVTPSNPPKLADALQWAKHRGAILELDKKETSSFRDIIAAVRTAGAENNVVLISYNDDQAKQIARLAPDLMLTASVRSRDHQKELEDAGIRAENLIAWMGTRNPNPRAFQAVSNRGIEVAFGTLGRPGERLDDIYLADGDASEYQDLVDDGLVLLATDEAAFVANHLTDDDRAWETCARLPVN